MSNAEEDKLRIRLAEVLSSGGVGYNQISQEVLYMLPGAFAKQYANLWDVAMGPVVRAPGDAMANAGELGKAGNNSALRGTKKGLGQSGGAKKLKRVFSVRNEDAFRFKDRIDKRLRAIAREIQQELAVYDEAMREAARAEGVEIAKAYGASREQAEEIVEYLEVQRRIGDVVRAGGKTRAGGSTRASTNTNRCTAGGHILNPSWKFCPIDGSAKLPNDPQNVKKGD